MDEGRLRPTESSRRNSREILKTLLCDDIFVDYFNVFLNLPVFGQRALFKRHSRGFIFYPPVKGQIHNRHVLDWFVEERYSLFIKTRLAHEFRLASKLQRVRFSFRFKSLGVEGGYGTELLQNLCRHLLGNVGGMYLFREHLRGTAGQRVLACWMHVQAFRKVKDSAQRVELMRTIRRHYLKPLPWLRSSGLTDLVALDILNFPVVPLEEERALRARQGTGKRLSQLELDPQCREALAHVQTVLLLALQSYWLPSYLLHVLASSDVKLLEELAKPTRQVKMNLEKFAALVKRYAVQTRTTLTSPPEPRAPLADRRLWARGAGVSSERGEEVKGTEGGGRVTEQEEKKAETEGRGRVESEGKEGRPFDAVVDSLPSLAEEVAAVGPAEAVFSPVVFDFSNVYRLSLWQPWGTQAAVVAATPGYDTDPSGRLLRNPSPPPPVSLFPDRVPSDTSQPARPGAEQPGEAGEATPSQFLSICGGFRFEQPTATSPPSVGTGESAQEPPAPTSSRSFQGKVFGPFPEPEAVARPLDPARTTTPTGEATAREAEFAENDNSNHTSLREKGQEHLSQEEEGQHDPKQEGEGQHDPKQEGEGQHDPKQEGEGQHDPKQEGQEDFEQELPNTRGFKDNFHRPLSGSSSTTSLASIRTPDSEGNECFQHESVETIVEGLTGAGVVLAVESLPQEYQDVCQDDGFDTFQDLVVPRSSPASSDRASQHTAAEDTVHADPGKAGTSPASTAGTEGEPQYNPDSSSEHDTSNNTSCHSSPKALLTGGHVKSPEEMFLLGKRSAAFVDSMRLQSSQLQTRVLPRPNVSEACEVCVPLIFTPRAEQKKPLLGDPRATARQLRRPKLVRDVSTSPEEETDEEGINSEYDVSSSSGVSEQDFCRERGRPFDERGHNSTSNRGKGIGRGGHTFESSRRSLSAVEGKYLPRRLNSADPAEIAPDCSRGVDESGAASRYAAASRDRDERTSQCTSRSDEGGRNSAESVFSGIAAAQTDRGVIQDQARPSGSSSSSASSATDLKQDCNWNARTSSSLSSSANSATATSARQSAVNEGSCVYRHGLMMERSRQSSGTSRQRESVQSVLTGPGGKEESVRTASLFGFNVDESAVQNRVTRVQQNEESELDGNLCAHEHDPEQCQKADLHVRTCRRGSQETAGHPDRGRHDPRASGRQTEACDPRKLGTGRPMKLEHEQKGTRKAGSLQGDSAANRVENKDGQERGSLGEVIAHLGLRVSPCSSSCSLLSLDSLPGDVATSSGSGTSLSSDVAGSASGSCCESAWWRFSPLRSSGSATSLGTSEGQSLCTLGNRAGQYLARQNGGHPERQKDIPRRKPGSSSYLKAETEPSDMGPLFGRRTRGTACRSSRSAESLQDLLSFMRDGKAFRHSASDHHLRHIWPAVRPRSLLREALAASDAAIVAEGEEERRRDARRAEGRQGKLEEESSELLQQARHRRRRQRWKADHHQSRNGNTNSQQLGRLSQEDSPSEQADRARAGGNSEASSFPEINVPSCCSSSDDAARRAADRRREAELLDCNFNSNPRGDLDRKAKKDLGNERSVFSESSSSDDFDEDEDDYLSFPTTDTEGAAEGGGDEEDEWDEAERGRRAEEARRNRERQLAKLVWRMEERARRKQAREEERGKRQQEKERLAQKREAIMKKFQGSEVKQRQRLSLAALTQHAVQDLLQHRQEDLHLDAQLAFFLYGSRDTEKDRIKADRRMLCLLACDVMAGEAFRGYLKVKQQQFYAKYLDFWVAMRRYVQLLGMVQLDRVAGPVNSYDIHKLIDQQVEHLGRTFLKDSFHTDPVAELGEKHEQVLKEDLKERLLDDLKARRHTPLISATMDVIANVLCSPATRYVLHDLRRLHTIALRDVSPVASLEALVTTKSDVTLGQNCPWRQEPEAAEDDHADGAKRAQNGPKRSCVLTEDHPLMAFNYIIAVSEDLNSAPLCDLKDLVAMVWSDLGSLHVHSPARVRQPFLRRLLTPRRMSTDQMKGLTTLTKTILDMEVDEQPDNIFSEDVDEDTVFPRRRSCLTRPMLDRLRSRRNAMQMDPLPKPKNFEEVLNDDLVRSFFRLYLLSQCPPDVDALKYVQAVQELSQVLDPESRAKYINIVRQKYLLGPRNRNLLVDQQMVEALGFRADLSVHDLTVLQVKVKKELRHKWFAEYTEVWPEPERHPVWNRESSTETTLSDLESSSVSLEDSQEIAASISRESLHKKAKRLFRVMQHVMSAISLVVYRREMHKMTSENQVVYMQKVLEQKGHDVNKLLEAEKARRKLKKVTMASEAVNKRPGSGARSKKKSTSSESRRKSIADAKDEKRATEDGAEDAGKKSRKEILKSLKEEKDVKARLRRHAAMNHWIRLSRLFIKFMRALRSPRDAGQFEDYLRREVDKADALNDKKVTMGDNVVYLRKTIKDQQIIVNRLPNDLRFFVQVDKYRKQALEFCDQKLKGRRCSKVSRRSLHFDLAFFNSRACVIVDCFLNDACSSPPCQINIPDADANKIAQTYVKNGASTGLFHTATLRLFPILFSFYRQFLREGKVVVGGYRTGSRVGDNPHPSVPAPCFDKATSSDVVKIWVEAGDRGPLPQADPVLIQPVSPRLARVPIKHRPPPPNADLAGIGRLGPAEHRLRFSVMAGLSHVIPLDPEERKVREEERLKLRKEQETAAAEARKKEAEKKEKERQEKEREKEKKEKERQEREKKKKEQERLEREKEKQEKERQEREKEKQERREQAKLTKGMSTEMLPSADAVVSPDDTKLPVAEATAPTEKEVAPRYAPAVAEALAIQEAMRKKRERKKVVKVQLRTDVRRTKYTFLLDESMPLYPEYLLLPQGQDDPRIPCTSALNRALLKPDAFPALPQQGSGAGDWVFSSSLNVLEQDPHLLAEMMSESVRRHSSGHAKHHQLVDGVESVAPLWGVKDFQRKAAAKMRRNFEKFLADEARRLKIVASLPEGWEVEESQTGLGKGRKSQKGVKEKKRKKMKKVKEEEMEMPPAVDPAFTMLGVATWKDKQKEDKTDKKDKKKKTKTKKDRKSARQRSKDKLQKVRSLASVDSPWDDEGLAWGGKNKKKKKTAELKTSKAKKAGVKSKSMIEMKGKKKAKSEEKSNKLKGAEKKASALRQASKLTAAKSLLKDLTAQGSKTRGKSGAEGADVETTKKKEAKEGCQTGGDYPRLLPPITAQDHIACVQAAEEGKDSYVSSSSSDLAQARVAVPSSRPHAAAAAPAAKLGQLPDKDSQLAELRAELKEEESPETQRARLLQERKLLALPPIPKATLQPLLGERNVQLPPATSKARRPLQTEGTATTRVAPAPDAAATATIAVSLPPYGREAARPSLTQRQQLSDGPGRLWRGFGDYGCVSTDQQVCALVEKMHQQTTRLPTPPAAGRHRPEPPDRSGPAAGLPSMTRGPRGPRPPRVTMSRNRTVIAKPPDLTLPFLVLKDGNFDAESRGSDKFSVKARALAYKEGNPVVSKGRVTTPDMSETQKLRKRRQQRESEPRKDK